MTMTINPKDFERLPSEGYMPAGAAPSQIYNALKYAHDNEGFTLDGFADALREHTVAIQRMRDLASPESYEYKTALGIADAAKAYRAARAALLAAQEAFAEAEAHLSCLLDQGLVDYCIDPSAKPAVDNDF